MYENHEGIKDQVFKERKSLILMVVSSVLLGLFVVLTVNYGNFNNAYFAVYAVWFGLSIWFSKSYLFLTPRRRYGTVKEIKNFKETYYTTAGGGGRMYQRGSTAIIEVDLIIEFDNGSSKEYKFVYKGDMKLLTVGDRIGIFRFLKMPVWE